VDFGPTPAVIPHVTRRVQGSVHDGRLGAAAPCQTPGASGQCGTWPTPGAPRMTRIPGASPRQTKRIKATPSGRDLHRTVGLPPNPRLTVLTRLLHGCPKVGRHPLREMRSTLPVGVDASVGTPSSDMPSDAPVSRFSLELTARADPSTSPNRCSSPFKREVSTKCRSRSKKVETAMRKCLGPDRNRTNRILSMR